MKFLFITLTALFSLVGTKSYAADVKIAPAILHSFESSFENATEVTWSVNNKLYKADFNYNGQYIAAFFDAEGTMLAATRNINSFQLPISLQQSLRKDYQDLWISELFEVSKDSGTYYYITLEDADTKIILKSSGTSGWSVYQKQRKS